MLNIKNKNYYLGLFVIGELCSALDLYLAISDGNNKGIDDYYDTVCKIYSLSN